MAAASHQRHSVGLVGQVDAPVQCHDSSAKRGQVSGHSTLVRESGRCHDVDRWTAGSKELRLNTRKCGSMPSPPHQHTYDHTSRSSRLRQPFSVPAKRDGAVVVSGTEPCKSRQSCGQAEHDVSHWGHHVRRNTCSLDQRNRNSSTDANRWAPTKGCESDASYRSREHLARASSVPSIRSELCADRRLDHPFLDESNESAATVPSGTSRSVASQRRGFEGRSTRKSSDQCRSLQSDGLDATSLSRCEEERLSRALHQGAPRGSHGITFLRASCRFTRPSEDDYIGLSIVTTLLPAHSTSRHKRGKAIDRASLNLLLERVGAMSSQKNSPAEFVDLLLELGVSFGRHHKSLLQTGHGLDVNGVPALLVIGKALVETLDACVNIKVNPSVWSSAPISGVGGVVDTSLGVLDGALSSALKVLGCRSLPRNSS